MKITVEGTGATLVAAYIQGLLGDYGLPVAHDGRLPDWFSLQSQVSKLGNEMESEVQVVAKDALAWGQRLEFDPDISDEYPAIKGTLVNVGRIVSEVVDGRDIYDILKRHPEITADDVYACLDYAVWAGDLSPTAVARFDELPADIRD